MAARHPTSPLTRSRRRGPVWGQLRSIVDTCADAGMRQSAAHPAGDKDCRSGLIQPERVEPDHVVDTEIIFWIVALHVVVPDIEDILPGDGYQWGILLHEV